MPGWCITTPSLLPRRRHPILMFNPLLLLAPASPLSLQKALCEFPHGHDPISNRASDSARVFVRATPAISRRLSGMGLHYSSGPRFWRRATLECSAAAHLCPCFCASHPIRTPARSLPPRHYRNAIHPSNLTPARPRSPSVLTESSLLTPSRDRSHLKSGVLQRSPVCTRIPRSPCIRPEHVVDITLLASHPIPLLHVSLTPSTCLHGLLPPRHFYHIPCRGLHYNSLTGTIPSQIEHLTALTALYANPAGLRACLIA